MEIPRSRNTGSRKTDVRFAKNLRFDVVNSFEIFMLIVARRVLKPRNQALPKVMRRDITSSDQFLIV